MSGISWTVLAGLMRALSIFAVGGKHADQLHGLLNTVAALLERGEAGRLALEQLCADVDVMVAQGREPTAEEWARLRARSDTAHAAIQAAAEAAPVAPDPAPGASSGGAPVESEGGETDEGARGTSKGRKGK